MTVVIDTNVLVSAFLNPFGTPAKILRLMIQGDINIVLNEPILQEYEAVLKRPVFALNQKDVSLILDVLRETGIQAPEYNGSIALPDRGDVPFLEAALTGKVDALVTGNKRHFPRGKCKPVRIMSPSEFMAIL